MAAWCGGEAAAFRVLFDRYAPRLLALVRRQVRSADDARDLVQQTFLQLHRARADYREGLALRPWVYTICLNLRREHFRKRARRPESPLELDGRSDPSEAPHDAAAADQARRVRDAVAALPPSQREVIELHWFDGLPFPEVAEVLGASLSAVKVRAHRGYERLRESLAGEFEVAGRNRPAAAGIRGDGGL